MNIDERLNCLPSEDCAEDERMCRRVKTQARFDEKNECKRKEKINEEFDSGIINKDEIKKEGDIVGVG